MTGVNPRDKGEESFDYLQGIDIERVPEMVAANEGFLAKLWARLGWLLYHRTRPREHRERPPP